MLIHRQGSGLYETICLEVYVEWLRLQNKYIWLFYFHEFSGSVSKLIVWSQSPEVSSERTEHFRAQ